VPTATADVAFDFNEALSLASQYWALASTISDYETQRNQLARSALTGWTGEFAQQFDHRMATSNATASDLEAAVRATANLWAAAWAHAAEQQKLVEWARHCQNLENNRSWLQKGWDSVFGDPIQLPPPPPAPATPAAPDFRPTTNPYSYP